VQNGAALGLGVAAMGSRNTDASEDLKDVLFMDSAVAGEASGYAMGLVMHGTAASEAIREMLIYAQETQHEKIIRGLAVVSKPDVLSRTGNSERSPKNRKHGFLSRTRASLFRTPLGALRK